MPSLTVQQLFHGTSPHTCLYLYLCLYLGTSNTQLTHVTPDNMTRVKFSQESRLINTQHQTQPCQYHNESQHTSNCLLLARLARLRCRPQLLLSECPDTRHPFSPHSVHGDSLSLNDPTFALRKHPPKKGSYIVLIYNTACVQITPILFIIAHITYLFERLTFASDRKERNNRDSNFGARYSAR